MVKNVEKDVKTVVNRLMYIQMFLGDNAKKKKTQ